MADEVLYTISEEFVKEGEGEESDVEIPSSSNLEYKAIPAFEDVRTKLLPVVKTDTWLRSIKYHLQKTHATTQSVFYKPLNNISRIDFGFTVAILHDGDEYHYVLNSYLASWHISSLTLVQIAQANLRKRLVQEDITWKTSETGIRFIHGLGMRDSLEDLAQLYDIQLYERHFASQSSYWVIIPCSQYAKLNFNPSPKSNQVFNPSKLKHDK